MGLQSGEASTNQQKRRQVLIRVGSFGLDRPEMVIWQEYLPTVKLPSVLGTKAASVIKETRGNENKLQDSAIVSAVKGDVG